MSKLIQKLDFTRQLNISFKKKNNDCIFILGQIQSKINQQKDQQKFTRCPDTYAYKGYKIQDVEADTNKFHLELNIGVLPSLESIGDKDPNNYISY